jgi:hypothetical protein
MATISILNRAALKIVENYGLRHEWSQVEYCVKTGL